VPFRVAWWWCSCPTWNRCASCTPWPWTCMHASARSPTRYVCVCKRVKTPVFFCSWEEWDL
jgi:hypothetical protein